MNNDFLDMGKRNTHQVKAVCIKAKDLAVLRFEEISVRVARLNGDPWFVVADVCKALELSSPTKSIKALDDDEKALISIQGLSRGNDEANIVSESGFYKMIVRCRKASIEGTLPHRFTNWVFRSVVPGIRKTGAYGIPWGDLHDFTRRKEQYQISASKRGKALQRCKRQKQELVEEEKRLIREYQPDLYS